MTPHLISVAEAAAILRVTPGRVRQLIAGGRLEATRVGPVLVLQRQLVERFAMQPRPVGYPRGRPRRREAAG